jgi:hypothetical protein
MFWSSLKPATNPEASKQYNHKPLPVDFIVNGVTGLQLPATPPATEVVFLFTQMLKVAVVAAA